MGDDNGIVVRLLPVRECIVEERLWRHGVELVSHVNYSQLERVCLSRAAPVPVGLPRSA